MTRILRKSPLVEAVCEFQLDAPNWDLTVPGLVYSRIKERFPETQEAPDVNFHIEQTQKGIRPSAQSSFGRMQFWAQDRKRLVQVGQQTFSVHELSYKTWFDFKELIEGLLADYESAAPFRAIRHVSLRYVNRFPGSHDFPKVEHIFNVYPQIPNSSDQNWLSWFQQVQIFQEGKGAILGVRSGYLPETPGQAIEGEVPMLFDINFAHVLNEPVPRTSISSWLETAHEEIEKMFFAGLTDNYLNSLGMEVQDGNIS